LLKRDCVLGFGAKIRQVQLLLILLKNLDILLKS
jgi:hypothetical protein